jgi:peptidoglycan/xylan/chitin deacetylase (PgdA/CDA1 family)
MMETLVCGKPNSRQAKGVLGRKDENKRTMLGLKQAIKKLICYVFFYSGLFRFYLRFPNRKKDVSILMYHHIKDGGDEFCGGLQKATFRKQISFLKKNYQIYPLGNLVSSLRSKEGLPENSVAITFDDGYEDFYESAFPVLREANVPATVFLVAEAIEKQVPLWTKKVASVLKNVTTDYLEFDVNGSQVQYDVRTISQKLKALGQIKAYLKLMPNEDCQKAIAQLEIKYSTNGQSAEPWLKMLSWEQIREMKGKGITFGAHTKTHAILTKISELDVREEIEGSKGMIESRIGDAIEHFCYPNGEEGDFDESHYELLRDIISRLGLADVDGFGLRRSDYQNYLKRLGA